MLAGYGASIAAEVAHYDQGGNSTVRTVPFNQPPYPPKDDARTYMFVDNAKWELGDLGFSDITLKNNFSYSMYESQNCEYVAVPDHYIESCFGAISQNDAYASISQYYPRMGPFERNSYRGIPGRWHLRQRSDRVVGGDLLVRHTHAQSTLQRLGRLQQSLSRVRRRLQPGLRIRLRQRRKCFRLFLGARYLRQRSLGFLAGWCTACISRPASARRPTIRVRPSVPTRPTILPVCRRSDRRYGAVDSQIVRQDGTSPSTTRSMTICCSM